MNTSGMGLADNLLTKPTRFKALGIGEISLVGKADSRFGGMGCVYFENGNAFKIFHDPAAAAKQQMPERLAALTKLDHPAIVGPKGLIYDQTGKKFVGFWMPTVQGEELTRLLTMQYQQEHGIGIPELVKFLEQKREAIRYAHDQGAIIGDPNERNGVFRKVARKGLFCWHLDVDNWGIAGLQPAALAPHIQDHQHKGPLTTLTDWYGEGVVWFWLLALTHPYGGRLSGFDHRDKEHLVKRMKARASIFHPGVKPPPATRDLSELPKAFVEWCGRVFEHGERTEPPSLTAIPVPPQAALTMVQTVGVTGGKFEMIKLFGKPGDPVVRIFPCGVVFTRSGALYSLESGKQLAKLNSDSCEVVLTNGHYLIGYHEDEALRFVCVRENDGRTLTVNATLSGDRFMSRDDRLYLISDGGVLELKLWPMGDGVIVTSAQNWSIAPLTMTWLSGIGVQSIFGQAHVWVPFTEGSYTTIRVAELDRLSPVASYVNGRHAVITAQGKGGRSFRVDLKFDAKFGACEVKVTNIPSPTLNLTILDKGMVGEIVDEGELLLSFPFTDRVKDVKDRHISEKFQLAHQADKLLCLAGGDVWHLKVN